MLLLLPLTSQAQKRHEYTFDFTKPESLNPPVVIDDEDYAGAEQNLTNRVLLSSDRMVSISFDGRGSDGRGGVLVTGSENSDHTFDHHLFIARGASMIITGNGVELDTLLFSSSSYVSNLRLSSPTGVGITDARNESWYCNGATGVNQLQYLQYGATVSQIRQITVIYRSPMDVLEPVSVTPADRSDVHAIETIELAFNQTIEIGTDAKFELTGPRGFNPVMMVAQAVGNRVVLALPEGVTIDESNEARRGTYTLTVYEKSVIGDDEDGYYNKKTTYTFNVVEAFNKFEKVSIYPDDQVDQVTEIPNGIVIGFSAEVGKFSADEIKLLDRDGNNVRSMKAQWLDESEYVEGAPFYKHDKDIYQFVKLVYTGNKTAAVKATGIYHFTVPEGFIWNNKYDATAEDEGISAGARFNPEFTIEYNVNGVVYPSDEVLQAAKDLLDITGAGYPAADSPARLALQALVNEGVGADAIFEEAMAAFYAETAIELPSDGYYLLSAVPSEGDEVYVSYEAGKIGLTKNVEDAAHLLAAVNDDGTVVFETPDHKFLTQMMPSAVNVTSSEGKMNKLTFGRLVLKDDDGNDLYTPQQLFGLWSINGIVATNDEGTDITAYALVNVQNLTFGTDRDKSLRYFTATQTNAFRLTETDEPIPAATYTFDPVSGTELETLHRIELTFTNIDEVTMSEDAKSQITLIGSSTLSYNPDQITAVSGSKNKFLLSFEDVKAGTYTLTIPKGVFTWTFNDRPAQVQEITASYTVKSGIDFCYDFLTRYPVYYYNRDMNAYIRDVDMNELILETYTKVDWGISNKQVSVQDADDMKVYSTGHFVPIEDFEDPNVPTASAIKLVLDKPIKMGDMQPGVYTYVIAPATFGDENFAKWLKDPQTYSKNDCHVNSVLRPNILVDNDKANIKFTPALNSKIATFSEVTITFPYFTNVSIAEGMSLNIYNTFTNEEIDGTLAPVEGSTNTFRFTSTEQLMSGSIEGEYMIVIPTGMFVCKSETGGTTLVPTHYTQQFWFYGRSDGGDAIDRVNVGQRGEDIYDLAGRRVNDTKRAGVYIINGKKVVIR